MSNKIKNLYQKLGITRYKRIENYIQELEKNIKISSKSDDIEVSTINVMIKERIKNIKQANRINLFFYFGIYFSFFSIFFSNYFILSEINFLISQIVGFFGTTIFIIIIFFMNRFIDLYYQDLNLLSAHIISIYEKHNRTKSELFGQENNYGVFIDFFKKRGF